MRRKKQNLDLRAIADQNEEYRKEVLETIHAVLKRVLFTVERFAQGMCVDLSERGLEITMETKMEKLDLGMSLLIKYIPKEETIQEAMKNAKFRALCVRMMQELKRIKRGMVFGK